jgi:hypothetical protein
LLLALALWALLVVAGSAVALAADSQAAVPADPLAAAPADAPSALVANDKAASAGGAAAQPAAPMPADAATQPAAAEEPFDPDSVLGPEPPTRVRVAILNATGKPGGANKVAVLLGEYKRQALEDQIGLQIEVVNLSAADNVRPGQSILFYRPEFLRAALAMAKAIPGEQFVEPMRPAGLKRMGVDVEIVVGKELP